MKAVKSIMKLTAIFAFIASLFGCSQIKPQVLDGPDSVYKDSDYRSIYANELDFDSYEGQPYFAVAFLGYGSNILDYRNAYVEELFKDLGDFAVEQVSHIDYAGDEWYLIVPRYKDAVDIKNLENDEVHTIYNGEAFTVKCNLSDIHPNIEISTAQNLSGHKFSPQISGDGKLAANPNVHDITDYSEINKE